MGLLQTATVGLATFLFVLRVAAGNYTVSLHISSYSNPEHKHANGGCCDFWCGDCDNYFVVCMRSDCQHTGEVGDSDEITFDSSVGRLPNPITFDVPEPWRGCVLVVVDVFDKDDYFFPYFNGDEYIDNFLLNSISENLTTFEGRFGRGKITVSLSVTCSQDHYGEACDVYCAANRTHSCGPDGSLRCADGWEGESCDICVPLPNCSAVGGYCESPGDCLCRDGFTGALCTDTITSPPAVTTASTPSLFVPESSPPADTTASTPSLLVPEPQPHSDGSGGTNVGAVIGGVVAVMVILVVISTVLVLVCLCYLYRHRKGVFQQQMAEEDTHSLVQPLVGENPIYMEHHRGSHVLQDTTDYHQFSNPIYQDISPTEPPEVDATRRDTTSHTYSYPRVCSHLVSSVYLPGDDSPIPSVSTTPSHHPVDRTAGTETADQHYEFCNGNMNCEFQSGGNGGITGMEDEQTVEYSHRTTTGLAQSRHSVPNFTIAGDNNQARPLSTQYFWL